MAEVGQRTSLEQRGGPIDALETDASLLAEYDRWLVAAAKRRAYQMEKSVEEARLAAVREEREAHKRHGHDLQRAAWRQRGQIHAERSRLVLLNQAKGQEAKREAEQRKEEKRYREARWERYASRMHDEVAETTEDVRQARALNLASKQIGARTLRAATGAIERRKSEMEAAKEAEARAVRDAVRSASVVRVSPETAAAVASSSAASSTIGSGGGGPSSASSPSAFRGTRKVASARGPPSPSSVVLRNPDSVLAQPVSARMRRNTAIVVV